MDHINSTFTGHQLFQQKGKEIRVTNQAADGILQIIPPDAASSLNEATLGHQQEEPAQRKFMKSSVEKRNKFNYKTCCQGYYSV